MSQSITEYISTLEPKRRNEVINLMAASMSLALDIMDTMPNTWLTISRVKGIANVRPKWIASIKQQVLYENGSKSVTDLVKSEHVNLVELFPRFKEECFSYIEYMKDRSLHPEKYEEPF